MSGPELKPCPFCGRVAWLNDYDALYDGRPPQSRCPQCKSCGCNLGYLPTAEKAVAAWNTRAPITVQDAARVLLISPDRGVCVGGRWDGWLMIRHPDGHWVSHHKLDAVDPRTEMTDALRAIAEGK